MTTETHVESPVLLAPIACERCRKRLGPPSLCVCEAIKPLKSRLKLLVLQHPQEPKETLGTGLITSLLFAGAELKVGLSWRNLSHAVGSEIKDPKRWGVLYLGSAKPPTPETMLAVVDKQGKIREGSDVILQTLDGLIVIDGTWSQAKTLWWRNAWLLKLQRLVLNSGVPSVYGQARKEPRRECLSTLESAVYALGRLQMPRKKGAEIVASEWVKQGLAPLQLLLSNIPAREPRDAQNPTAHRPFRAFRGAKRDYRKSRGGARGARTLRTGSGMLALALSVGASMLLQALAPAVARASVSAVQTVTLEKFEFQVETNVKMFRFKGESKTIRSELEREGTTLKRLKISVPVDPIQTGMDLRDRHMKERIFKNEKGEMPDVVFESTPGQPIACAKECTVAGTLLLHGQSRPLTLAVHTDPAANRATGEATIALTDFGIDPPSHAGIKVDNAVKVRFEVKVP